MKDNHSEEIAEKVRSLQKRYTFVEMRSRFITNRSERIFHDIGILKAEKELLSLVQQHMTLLITSPNAHIRATLTALKSGALTGKIFSKEMTWEELYLHVDHLIADLELKYELVQHKEQELERLVDAYTTSRY